jgi:hypothetical protein
MNCPICQKEMIYKVDNLSELCRTECDEVLHHAVKYNDDVWWIEIDNIEFGKEQLGKIYCYPNNSISHWFNLDIDCEFEESYNVLKKYLNLKVFL